MRTFLRTIYQRHDPVRGLAIFEYNLNLDQSLKTILELTEADTYILKICLIMRDHDGKEKCLSMKYIASTFDRTDPSTTLRQYLDSLSNVALPWDDHLPDYEVANVYSIDAHLWDFKATPVKLGFDPTTAIPPEDKHDLVLSKPNIDMRFLLDHSLIFINGFCHYSDANDDELFVKDGFKSQTIGNDNQIDIMDFEKVGRIERVRLSRANIIKPVDGLSISQHLYLHIPNMNQRNRKIAFSIGGFLHFVHPEDKLITKVGGNVFRIDFNAFNWTERFLMLKENLFDDNLGMERYQDNRVDIQALYSEETIMRLMDLSQTFMIFIDCPERLHHSRQTLGDFSVPGRYEHHEYMRYPVRCSDGRYLPYLAFKQKPYSVIQTIDTRRVWYSDFETEYKDDPSRPFYEETVREQQVKLAEVNLIQTYRRKN